MEWYRWDEKPVDGQRVLVWFDEHCCAAGCYRRRSVVSPEGLDPMNGAPFMETTERTPYCWQYLPLPPEHVLKVKPVRFSTGARK